MTTRPDPERIWLEPHVEGVPTDRSWADSDVWAELDDPTLVPTEYVRADLARAMDGRVVRAVAALNEAPDVGNGMTTKSKAQAIADANQRAWTILTEGMFPSSQQRAEDVP